MNRPRVWVGLGLASLLLLFAWLLAASTENPPPPTGYEPWRTLAFLASLAATTAFAGHLVPRKRFRRLGFASRVAGWAASLPIFLDLFVYLYVLLFGAKLPLTHSPLLTWHSKLHCTPSSTTYLPPATPSLRGSPPTSTQGIPT